MTAPHHGSEGCRELLARLSEYLDGDLDGVVCAEIEAHLGDCPPCHRFLESLRRTIRLVERSPKTSLPPALRQAVLEAYARARLGDPS